MLSEIDVIQKYEGVYGPEVLMNVVSGQSCLRDGDRILHGEWPSPPVSNAFFVWLGRPILVVSEGVAQQDVAVVTAMLRRFLEAPDLPIIVRLGRSENCAVMTVSNGPSQVAHCELARAEVYAQIDCGLTDTERMEVEVDGERFGFTIKMQMRQDGTFRPVVT